MVLHIYNPEHDIALAKNDPFFTAPKAARITREHFCHIPIYWANDGDWILVDDIEQAMTNLKNVQTALPEVRFVTFKDLAALKDNQMPECIKPWGWDRKIVAQLIRCNPLCKRLVPTETQLDDIRRMSSRQFVAENIIGKVVGADKRLVGEMAVLEGNPDEIVEIINSRLPVVVKSPWSCSGRGVRFFEEELSESEKGWVRNIISEQGCVLAEPLYEKVVDFAMEFTSEKDGIRYLGLNIFATKNGAYLQNSQGTENEKSTELSQFVDVGLLTVIQETIIDTLSSHFEGKYEGPFGIDMMIVRDGDNKTKVHPCVEMNLRRTMGQIGLT